MDSKIHIELQRAQNQSLLKLSDDYITTGFHYMILLHKCLKFSIVRSALFQQRLRCFQAHTETKYPSFKIFIVLQKWFPFSYHLNSNPRPRSPGPSASPLCFLFPCDRSQQTMIHLPNPAHHLVLYSRKTKNSFCISTWLGGKIQRNYFMTSKTKFQISTSTKKVLLKHRYTHSIHIYLCLLLHYNDRVDWLQQRPYGLQNLKYLLSGPSQKRLPTCTQ